MIFFFPFLNLRLKYLLHVCVYSSCLGLSDLSEFFCVFVVGNLEARRRAVLCHVPPESFLTLVREKSTKLTRKDYLHVSIR